MEDPDQPVWAIQTNALVELKCLMDPVVRRSVGGFKAHPYNIPKGSIAAYYPETNGLIPLSHYDPRCKTPASKSIPVSVGLQRTT